MSMTSKICFHAMTRKMRELLVRQLSALNELEKIYDRMKAIESRCEEGWDPDTKSWVLIVPDESREYTTLSESFNLALRLYDRMHRETVRNLSAGEWSRRADWE